MTDSGSVAELIKANPAMKSSILDSFKFALSPFVEKLSLKHTLVHKAMKDFFDICDEAPLRAVSDVSYCFVIVFFGHKLQNTHCFPKCFLWA